jgi:hypothetical protein
MNFIEHQKDEDYCDIKIIFDQEKLNNIIKSSN